jgi:hypothetical protein
VPAFAGPLVGFSLGVALAWLGRAAAERDDDRRRARRTLLVALFAALVFAPACAYFVLFAPDWAIAYLIDQRAVPSAAILALLLADAGAVVAGFVAGRYAGQRRAVRALAVLGILPASIAVLLVLAFLRELLIDGTFHEVLNHFGTRPVLGGPLGYAVAWMDAMIALGFALTARALGDPAGAPSASAGDRPGPTRRLGLGRR